MSNLELSIILKICSIITITVAASIWASASVESRSKYRDEQTLIGGMIWSQAIIPMGLIISQSIKESLDLFMHAYYQLSGVALCAFTGVVLLVEEYKVTRRYRRLSEHVKGQSFIQMFEHKYDKLYLCIGILSLIVGAITLTDFILLINNN